MKYFTKEEIRDLVIAIVAVTLIFSAKTFPNIGFDLDNFPVYFLAVITAFLFHELAHKFTAMKFNCAAFFKLWPQGIIFGLILMFTGFKFVAPGAVMIFPFMFGRWGYRRIHLTNTEMGLIALAGPLVNLSFALIFSLLPGAIFNFLFMVNSWLYLFNMLPIPPLDGSKVMMWNTGLWVFFFIIGLALMIPYVLI